LALRRGLLVVIPHRTSGLFRIYSACGEAMTSATNGPADSRRSGASGRTTHCVEARAAARLRPDVVIGVDAQKRTQTIVAADEVDRERDEQRVGAFTFT
jgi:hypothetical protein